MQPPTGVPPYAPPCTTALVALPLVEKVTTAFPGHIGPPVFLQLGARAAAQADAGFAAAVLKGALPPAAGAAAAVLVLAAVVVDVLPSLFFASAAFLASSSALVFASSTTFLAS